MVGRFAILLIMKTKIAVVAVSAALFAAIGCSSPGRGFVVPVEDVPYVLAPGRTFEGAVCRAAARRRWTPQKISAETIRCTLVQREHRVVVDVVQKGSSFSIRLVESNIPIPKYNQWVDNLRREIVARAALVD